MDNPTDFLLIPFRKGDKRNLTAFSSLYFRNPCRKKRISKNTIHSLSSEFRMETLRLPSRLEKKLRRWGLFRVKDVELFLSKSTFLLSVEDKRLIQERIRECNVCKTTCVFENRQLLLLIFLEMHSFHYDLEFISDEDLIDFCDNAKKHVALLSPGQHSALLRWIKNVLHEVTKYILLPWLDERGGVAIEEEVEFWMSLRSEAAHLQSSLGQLLSLGFSWEGCLWGPFLRCIDLNAPYSIRFYISTEENALFLQSLFELLNRCFYKRGQLYKFEYLLQLFNRDIFAEQCNVCNVFIRCLSYIPGLRMRRTSEGLLVQKTGEDRFVLDQ